MNKMNPIIRCPNCGGIETYWQLCGDLTCKLCNKIFQEIKLDDKSTWQHLTIDLDDLEKMKDVKRARFPVCQQCGHAAEHHPNLCDECLEEIKEVSEAIRGQRLKDSGARREFESGAVRDISKGKGRCDLLPLDTIERVLNDYEYWSSIRVETTQPMPTVLESINQYLNTVKTSCLSDAICRFVDDEFKGDIHEAIIELSKHYEAGAEKYSPNNWKLGIDLHCFIDSTIRHYLKYLRKDTDEPHNRAVLWNLIGAIWTQDNHPELNDLA